jgi:hypothetical protein
VMRCPTHAAAARSVPWFSPVPVRFSLLSYDYPMRRTTGRVHASKNFRGERFRPSQAPQGPLGPAAQGRLPRVTCPRHAHSCRNAGSVPSDSPPNRVSRTLTHHPGIPRKMSLIRPSPSPPARRIRPHAEHAAASRQYGRRPPAAERSSPAATPAPRNGPTPPRAPRSFHRRAPAPGSAHRLPTHRALVGEPPTIEGFRRRATALAPPGARTPQDPHPPPGARTSQDPHPPPGTARPRTPRHAHPPPGTARPRTPGPAHRPATTYPGSREQPSCDRTPGRCGH